MPRIPDEIRSCAIYLYPDHASAVKGRSSGGSGFLLGFHGNTPEPLVPVPPFPEPEMKAEDFNPRWFVYAVTNGHVIKEAPVVRINTLDGKTEIVTLEPRDWFCHKSSDVAVAPIEIKPTHHEALMIDLGMVLTEDEAREIGLGIGDDVVMVGRFINHDGRQTNQPTVRFGNISMVPGLPIKVEGLATPQEAYLIETRTIPGYSGSPVFLEVPTWELLWNAPGSRRRAIGEDTRVLSRLIGVAGGWLYGKRRRVTSAGREVKGWGADSNTGMMWCVPSYKLLELLNREDVRRHRDGMRVEWEPPDSGLAEAPTGRSAGSPPHSSSPPPERRSTP